MKTRLKCSPLVSWEHELCPTLPELRSVSQFGGVEANHLAWCWEPHPHWISDASGSVCHQEQQWEGLGKPGTPVSNARQDMNKQKSECLNFSKMQAKLFYEPYPVLTLWCPFTISTRFRWNMFLLCKRREADNTGRVPLNSGDRNILWT